MSAGALFRVRRAVLVGLATLVAGVGTTAPAIGAGPSIGAATTTTADPATVRAQSRALPNVTVVDLADGRRVRLRSLGRGRPMVLWFWAPG